MLRICIGYKKCANKRCMWRFPIETKHQHLDTCFFNDFWCNGVNDHVLILPLTEVMKKKGK